MLRKRGKAAASSSDPSNHGGKGASFFRLPSLFIGLGGKLQSDCESVMSPTSPLEWKSLCNHVSTLVSSKRSSNGFSPKCWDWDCEGVGLGIVDSLSSQIKLGGKSLSFSESRKKTNIPSRLSNIVEASKSSLVLETSEAHVLQRSRSCSSDSMQFPLSLTRLFYCNAKPSSENICCDKVKEPRFEVDCFSGLPGSLPVDVSPSHCLVSSLSPREIELSEDYTRIISRGPNPKTTHVFGDCVLESNTFELELGSDNKGESLIGSYSCLQSSDHTKYSSGFFSFCVSCNKMLKGENDNYIYRGEKAFCSSSNCRSGIFAEEEMESSFSCAPGTPKSGCGDDEEDAIFYTDMASGS